MRSAESSSLSKTKVADLPSTNRRNWLIYLHYVRREFDLCLSLIKEQLDESGAMCEFPLFLQGLMLREKGQLQESLLLLRRCRQLNPLASQTAKHIGQALFLLGEYKLALTMFGHAASMCPDHSDWDISYNKAVCRLRLGDVAAATAEVTESLTGRQHPRGYQLLARVALCQEDTETAVAVYQQAIHNFPDDVDLTYSLGMLYLEKDRPDEALEQFGLALAYQPNHTDSLMAAGFLIQKQGDPDVALSKYRAAARKNGDTAALWNNIGMCYYEKKKYIASISCLKRANFLDPLDTSVLYSLGVVHLAMKQYSTAFHYILAAVNLIPDSAQLFLLMAVALSNLEDNVNAREAYEAAVKLAPDSAETRLNYAIFLQRTGCSDESRHQMARFDEAVEDGSVSGITIDHNLVDTSIRLRSLLDSSTDR